VTTRGSNGAHERLRFLEDDDVEVELSWHALTNVGHRREVNQDSFVVVPPIFAVADGMGGHTAGEIASAAVVRRLANLGGEGPVRPEAIEQALCDAVADIETDAGESELGTGTTVTGVAFGEDPTRPSWRVFNIGDSRVYQCVDRTLTQLTVDHSVVQHLLDTGAISAEEAHYHPHSNVITRAVGFNGRPVPDFSDVRMVAGQRLLVCSDGLSKELTDAGIEHYLSSAGTAQEAAESLMQQSLDNEGRDNITVIVIEVHAIGDPTDTQDLSRSLG